jgi:hypothetical protein
MIRTTAILAACLLLAPAQQAAAETSNCTEITSLPATISSQGVFCLKRDLSTGIATGDAITINTNNVTIDCNDWKLGGLGGGAGTQATAIRAIGRKNITIRNCGIRGFRNSIVLGGAGSAYHLVENNRIDLATGYAVTVEGDGHMVRGNRLYDIGNSTGYAGGIVVRDSGGVIDNTIQGVHGDVDHGLVIAIDAAAEGGAVVAGNRILNLSGAYVYGMVLGGPITATDNMVIRAGHEPAGSYTGFSCTGAVVLRDNVLIGFHPPGVPTYDCVDAGNVFHQPPV